MTVLADAGENDLFADVHLDNGKLWRPVDQGRRWMNEQALQWQDSYSKTGPSWLAGSALTLPWQPWPNGVLIHDRSSVAEGMHGADGLRDGLQEEQVNLEAEVPEVLFDGLREFIRAHPNWDQYRVITSALAGFLFQNGCSEHTVLQHYVDGLFLQQEQG